ncbi:hypothetical protein BHM03_00006650 [Ensete ventricosum]|nr:hypothetical protein BHM03_00006650 [Ensete ventricosum]
MRIYLKPRRAERAVARGTGRGSDTPKIVVWRTWHLIGSAKAMEETEVIAMEGGSRGTDDSGRRGEREASAPQ